MLVVHIGPPTPNGQVNPGPFLGWFKKEPPKIGTRNKKGPKGHLPYADYNRSSAGLDYRRAAVILRVRLYSDCILLN